MDASGSGESARRGRRRQRGGSAASSATPAGDAVSGGRTPKTGDDGRAEGPGNARSAGRSGNRGSSRGGDSPERLTEHRPTQLPADLAARAREVATPTAADLAAAEAELVLVRRNYVPKDAL